LVCIKSDIEQVSPPPISIDDEGQIQHEEDREVMGGVRVMRTIRLFRDEALLLCIGIFIQFLSVAMNAYLPQLTKAFNEATFVPLMFYN
jgi:hypothetical protein